MIDWHNQLKKISFSGYKTKEANIKKKEPGKEKQKDSVILKGKDRTTRDAPIETNQEGLKSENKLNNYFVDDLRLNSESYQNVSSFISNNKR